MSLEEEVAIYNSSNLTPTELFLLRLTFLAVDGDAKLLINYLSNTPDGREVYKRTLESLMGKSVINSTFKIPKEGESLNFKNIPFNKNFLKMYLRESHELGKELFEEYPPFINIGGKLCSIRNFTKANLFSLDDFCNYYAKQIKAAKVTHERVMDALRFGKEHNLLNYSIIEFIASMKWLEIEYIQKSGNVNGYTNSELL